MHGYLVFLFLVLAAFPSSDSLAVTSSSCTGSGSDSGSLGDWLELSPRSHISQTSSGKVGPKLTSQPSTATGRSLLESPFPLRIPQVGMAVFFVIDSDQWRLLMAGALGVRGPSEDSSPLLLSLL